MVTGITSEGERVSEIVAVRDFDPAGLAVVTEYTEGNLLEAPVTLDHKGRVVFSFFEQPSDVPYDAAFTVTGLDANGVTATETVHLNGNTSALTGRYFSSIESIQANFAIADGELDIGATSVSETVYEYRSIQGVAPVDADGNALEGYQMAGSGRIEFSVPVQFTVDGTHAGSIFLPSMVNYVQSIDVVRTINEEATVDIGFEQSGSNAPRPLADYFGNLPNAYGLDYSDLYSNYWEDAGGDLYDDGNYLSIDGNEQSIWGNRNLPDAVQADWGDYYFRTYASGTVLAVDHFEGNSFKIDGGLGADGDGDRNVGELQGFPGLKVFYNQTSHAGDPGLTKLIITDARQATLAENGDNNDTDSDYFEVSNLGNASFVIYATMVGSPDVDGGFRFDEQTMREFVTRFGSIDAVKSAITAETTAELAQMSDLGRYFYSLPNGYALDYSDLDTYYWDDAGGDLYDSGNYLYVNGNEQEIWSTENKLSPTEMDWGSYVYQTYKSGTVLAVSNFHGQSFTIDGGLGADSDGVRINGEVEGGVNGARVFYSLTSAPYDPGLTKLIITNSRNATMNASDDTDSDYFSLENVEDGSYVIYVTIAGTPETLPPAEGDTGYGYVLDQSAIVDFASRFGNLDSVIHGMLPKLSADNFLVTQLGDGAISGSANLNTDLVTDYWGNQRYNDFTYNPLSDNSAKLAYAILKVDVPAASPDNPAILSFDVEQLGRYGVDTSQLGYAPQGTWSTSVSDAMHDGVNLLIPAITAPELYTVLTRADFANGITPEVGDNAVNVLAGIDPSAITSMTPWYDRNYNSNDQDPAYDYSVAKLVDGDPNTFFRGVPQTPDHGFKFTLDQPAVVNAVRLTTADQVWEAPAHIKMYGSNYSSNIADMELLTSASLEYVGDSNTDYPVVAFANATAYKYYAMVVDQMQGEDSPNDNYFYTLRLAEVQLLSAPLPDIADAASVTIGEGQMAGLEINPDGLGWVNFATYAEEHGNVVSMDLIDAGAVRFAGTAWNGSVDLAYPDETVVSSVVHAEADLAAAANNVAHVTGSVNVAQDGYVWIRYANVADAGEGADGATINSLYVDGGATLRVVGQKAILDGVSGALELSSDGGSLALDGSVVSYTGVSAPEGQHLYAFMTANDLSARLQNGSFTLVGKNAAGETIDVQGTWGSTDWWGGWGSGKQDGQSVLLGDLTSLQSIDSIRIGEYDYQTKDDGGWGSRSPFEMYDPSISFVSGDLKSLANGVEVTRYATDWQYTRIYMDVGQFEPTAPIDDQTNQWNSQDFFNRPVYDKQAVTSAGDTVGSSFSVSGVPAHIALTANGDAAGRSFVVTGLDGDGNEATETITFGEAGYVARTEGTFASVTSIVAADGNDGLVYVNVGAGKVYDAPMLLTSFNDWQYDDQTFLVAGYDGNGNYVENVYKDVNSGSMLPLGTFSEVLSILPLQGTGYYLDVGGVVAPTPDFSGYVDIPLDNMTRGEDGLISLDSAQRVVISAGQASRSRIYRIYGEDANGNEIVETVWGIAPADTTSSNDRMWLGDGTTANLTSYAISENFFAKIDHIEVSVGHTGDVGDGGGVIRINSVGTVSAPIMPEQTISNYGENVRLGNAVAAFETASNLTFTSDDDLTDRVFTITGTLSNGHTVTEEVTGPAAGGIAMSAFAFMTVTSVTVDDGAAGTVKVGYATTNGGLTDGFVITGSGTAEDPFVGHSTSVVESYLKYNTTAATADSESDILLYVGTNGADGVQLHYDFAVQGAPGKDTLYVEYSSSIQQLLQGRVYFEDGASTATILIPVKGDDLREANETMSVSLTDSSFGTTIDQANNQTDVTILNDDDIVSVSSTPVAGFEGNGTNGVLSFTVTRLDGGAAKTVAWHIEGIDADDPSAASSGDFVATSGTVTFAQGATTAVVNVRVLKDRIYEADETFSFVLSDPEEGAGYTVGTAHADGIIYNDDVRVTVTPQTTGVAEGNAQVFTVTREGYLVDATRVNWSVSGESSDDSVAAIAGDFTGASALPSGALNFSAVAGSGHHNVQSQTITLATNNDTALVGDRTFTVNIQNPFGYQNDITTGSAEGRIVENDPVAITVSGLSQSEGTGDTPTTFTYELTRAGDASRALTLEWKALFTGATVLADKADFAGSVYASSIIGQSSEYGTTIEDGYAAEAIIGAPDVTEYGDSGNAWAAQTADNPDGEWVTVGFDRGYIANGIEIRETLGSGFVTKVELLDSKGNYHEVWTGTDPSPLDEIADFRIEFAATDYLVVGAKISVNSERVIGDWEEIDAVKLSAVGFGGTVSFAAGSATTNLTMDVIADATIERDEQFTLTFDAAYADVAGHSELATIAGDDVGFGVEVPVGTINEGSQNRAIEVTLFRVGDNSAADYTWSVTNADGSVINAADFADGLAGSALSELPGGAISFGAGEQSKTVTLYLVGDNVREANEAFVVNLKSADGSEVLATSDTISVLNDDSAISVAVNFSEINENSSASRYTTLTYTISRAGALNQVVSVDWAIQGGEGSITADDLSGVASLPSGSVTFNVGETQKTVSIRVKQDSILEANENINFVLSNISQPASASFTVQSVTTTVIDDDAEVNFSAVAVAGATVSEGADPSDPYLLLGTTNEFETVTFDVVRSGNLAKTSTVNWRLVNDAGTNSDDFTGATSGIVAFAEGEETKTITVKVRHDRIGEGAESFHVVLETPSIGTGVGTHAAALGTIEASDQALYLAPGQALVVKHSEGQEGTTTYEWTLQRVGDISGELTVDWTSGGAGIYDTSAPDHGADPNHRWYYWTPEANAADFGGSFPTGSVTFAAGAATATITVTVPGDTTVETTEGFYVRIARPADVDQILVNSPYGWSWNAASQDVYGEIIRDEGLFSITNEIDAATLSDANLAASSNSMRTLDLDTAKPETDSGEVYHYFKIYRQFSTAGDVNIEWKVIGDPWIEAVEDAYPLFAHPQSVAASVDDFATGQNALSIVSGMPSGIATIRDGEDFTVIAVKTRGDLTGEDLKTFVVQIQNVDAGNSISDYQYAQGYIGNDDPLFSVGLLNPDMVDGTDPTIEYGSKIIQEGDNVTYRVYRTGDLSNAARVDWTVDLDDTYVGGTSVTGSSYRASAGDFNTATLNGTLSFAAGEAYRDITLSTKDDAGVENWAEFFAVKLSNARWADGVTSAKSIGVSETHGAMESAIIDADPAGTTVAVSSTVTNGAFEGTTGSVTGTAITYTLTRSGSDVGTVAQIGWKLEYPWLSDDDVTTVTGDTTAYHYGHDYFQGLVTFGAGETTKQIVVNVRTDYHVEGDANYTFTLVDAKSVVELAGDGSSYWVGYPNYGTDANGNSGIFLANSGVWDSNGSGNLPDSGTMLRDGEAYQVTNTIKNDDVRLAIGTTTYNGYDTGRLDRWEGDATDPLTFTVTRYGRLDNDLTVYYSIANGTTDASDINEGNGSFTLAAVGDTTFGWHTYTITLSDVFKGDIVAETDETFTLSLSNNNGLADAQYAGDANVRFQQWADYYWSDGAANTSFDVKVLNDDTVWSIAPTLREGSGDPIVAQSEGDGDYSTFSFVVSRPQGDESNNYYMGAAQVSWKVVAPEGTFYATNVLAKSSEYSPHGYAAHSALGAPDVASYGDSPSAWYASDDATGEQWLAVGFGVPRYATGLSVFESDGAGFVTKVELIDENGTLHRVWPLNGETDSSADGSLAEFKIQFEQTDYRVIGAKVYVDSDHVVGNSEAIDAIALHGPQVTADDFFGFGGAMPTGTVSFAAGETEKTVTLRVAGDSIVETSEMFTVELDSVNHGQIDAVANELDMTIRNDDQGILITDVSAIEGTTDTTTDMVFSVTRMGVLSGTADATWTVRDGSTDENDTTGTLTGALSFSDSDPSVSYGDDYFGVQTRTVSVTVKGDTTVEGNDNFYVDLSSLAASVGTLVEVRTTAEGVILNDDTRFTITKGAALAEGDATGQVFTITRSAATVQDQTINWSVGSEGGSHGASPDDFDGITSGSVTFTGSELTKTIVVKTAADAAAEVDESYYVEISAGGGVSPEMLPVQLKAFDTILNDDGTPDTSLVAPDSYVGLAGAASAVEGNSGSTYVEFTVNRSGALGFAGTVHWAVTAGTAVAADFPGNVLPSGTLTMPVGADSVVLRVPVKPESQFEADQTFTVTLSAPSFGLEVDQDSANGAGSASATGTIINDDAAVEIVAPADLSIPEGTSDTPTELVFTLNRSGNTDVESTVNWDIAYQQSVYNGEGDFVVENGSVTFAAGEMQKTVTVQIVADSVAEGNEEFRIRITAPANSGTSVVVPDGQNAARVFFTVENDDDDHITVATAATDVSEGDPALDSEYQEVVFTVTRENAFHSVSFDWSVAGSGDFALNSDRFLATAGTVTWDALAGADALDAAARAAALTTTFSVFVRKDELGDFDRDFTVTLNNASTGSVLVQNSLGVTIVNDDPALQAVLNPVDGLYGYTEGTGASGNVISFQIRRTGDTSADATVDWELLPSGDNPVNLTDFGGYIPSGSVRFRAGETVKTVQFLTSADMRFEADEGFTIELSNATGGDIIVDPRVVSGTITNDDNVASVQLSSSNVYDVAANGSTPPQVIEGDSTTRPISFDIVVNGRAGDEVTVYWALEGSGKYPADAFDFVDGSGSALDGMPTGYETLTINGDGTATATVTTYVHGDLDYGQDETFRLRLTEVDNGAIGTSSASVVITNNDSEVSIVRGTGFGLDGHIPEGQSGTTAFHFTVSRVGDLSREAVVAYTLDGFGDNTVNLADIDSVALAVSSDGTINTADGLITFGAGQSTIDLVVYVNGDTTFESNEGLLVHLAQATDGQVTVGQSAAVINEEKATATAIVQNDDNAGIYVTGVVTIAPEGSDAHAPKRLVYEVLRNGDNAEAITIDYTLVDDGVNALPTDAMIVGGLSGSVTLAAGQSIGHIEVEIVPNTTIGSGFGFNLVATTAAAGVSVLSDPIASKVFDDDTGITISLADGAAATMQEGADGTSTTYEFVVNRAGVDLPAFTVDWELGGIGISGANIADFADGQAFSGTLSFAEGETSQSIFVTVAGDNVVEMRDAFRVSLDNVSEPSQILLVDKVDCVIANDDLVTAGNDVIYGANGVDMLNGFSGNDSIFGLGGSDVLFGGDGDDVLDGGTGSDQIYGGFGRDTLIVSGASLADATASSADEQKLVFDGGAGIDTLRLADGGIVLDLDQVTNDVTVKNIEKIDLGATDAGNTLDLGLDFLLAQATNAFFVDAASQTGEGVHQLLVNGGEHDAVNINTGGTWTESTWSNGGVNYDVLTNSDLHIQLLIEQGVHHSNNPA